MEEVQLNQYSDYRFNSNTYTHMFLLATQAFCIFFVRLCFFVYNLGSFGITER